MKKINIIAISVILGALAVAALVAACADKDVPYIFSCRSELTPSRACLQEAQTGSVHGTTFTVPAIAPPPAGKQLLEGVEWTFTGVALVPAGQPVQVAYVQAPPCGDIEAVACFNKATKGIELLRGRAEAELDAALRHELRHAAGGDHPDQHLSAAGVKTLYAL